MVVRELVVMLGGCAVVAQEVAEGCRQPGGPAHAVVPFDLLGDEAELTAAANAAAAAFDGFGVDFLVHNAGELLAIRHQNSGPVPLQHSLADLLHTG